MQFKQIIKLIIVIFLKLVILLVSVTSVSFALVSMSPVDPIQAYIGADMMNISAEQREAIEQYWGLHEPALQQFYAWFQSVVTGDFGTSLIFRKSVLSVISERFFSSVLLMGTAWIISGILGFVLGLIAGAEEGSLIDKFIKTYSFTLASTPPFWIGILLLMVFAVSLQLFPIGLSVPAGMLTEKVTIMDRLKHLVLPAITLSVIGVANVVIHTRQKVIDIFKSDYVMFARVKGENKLSILRHHVLRNALLPAVSIHFASFGELFGGAILAEQVFSYPGLGQAVVQAGLRSDVPLLLGIVIFSTIFVFIGNMIADILYRVIDPKIRSDQS